MTAPLGFLDSLDIANRACQHLGQSRIRAIGEDSKQHDELTFAYDKLRQSELRRNVWTFATRRVILRPTDTDTMILDPHEWQPNVTYSQGALVKDSNGVIWSSTVAANLNNDPVLSTAWEQYFGNLAVFPYNASQGYFTGELVYMPAGNPGGFVVFMSLSSDNTNVPPDVATAWDATVTYNKDQAVSYNGSQWRSLIEVNMGIAPADTAPAFDITAIYASGQKTLGSDGFIYQSINGNNTGHDPVTDGGVNWTATGIAAAWVRSPAVYPSALSWLPIAAAVQNLAFTYPIGAGPVSQMKTRNVFKLPAGFLRVAPQMPKAGSTSILGASTGLQYTDWEFENGYLVSDEPNFIMFRFVTDMKDVARMDPMFCEGLAAKLALETCETLTGSLSKAGKIASEYERWMSDARTENAIEAGSEEPPVDDWEACRY